MDSGCAAPTPSLHCQRIARAKWEFLFGTPAEDGACRGEKGESTPHVCSTSEWIFSSSPRVSHMLESLSLSLELI